MSTHTLAEVLQHMADDYGLGRRGTNTGTSSSQITDDANLGGPDAAKMIDAGCQILIDAGTRAGDITQLSAKPILASGVATVDPNFGGALSTDSTYIILRRGLRFQSGGLYDKVNQAHQRFKWEKYILPVTLAVDGDMQESDTSSWTGVDGGGGANTPTLAKANLGHPLGIRVLRVTNNATGAGDYAHSGNIAVEEGASYYIEVTGMISSTGDASDAGTLVVYDVTNSAALTLQHEDIDRFEPEVLVNTVGIPSGCKQIQVRLTCDAVSDVIEWTNLIIRKSGSTDHVLPDRPTKPIDIGRVLQPASDLWGRREPWHEIPAKPQQVPGGLWELHTERGCRNSLWYEAFLTPAELTAVTSTTTIPAQDLAAVAAEMVLRPLSSQSREWAERYEYAAQSAAGVIDAYLSNTQVTRGESPSEYPVPQM